jgi:hypothetical protein
VCRRARVKHPEHHTEIIWWGILIRGSLTSGEALLSTRPLLLALSPSQTRSPKTVHGNQAINHGFSDLSLGAVPCRCGDVRGWLNGIWGGRVEPCRDALGWPAFAG